MPADRLSNNRKLRSNAPIPIKAALAAALAILAAPWPAPGLKGFFDLAYADPSGSGVERLELRIDPANQARGFCKGLKALASVGADFEFFDRGLTGGRERIFYAAWQGRLSELAPGRYSMSGADPTSGAEYDIFFTQADPGAIELQLIFKTPSRPSNLEFEVAKLSADFFKGGGLTAYPKSIMDAENIPVEPRSLSSRMLLSGKSRVYVQGALCDIEITDLMDRRSLYAADGRSMPWDRHKSIVFGAQAVGLAPGGRQAFNYRIRALAPTLPIPAAVGISPPRLFLTSDCSGFCNIKPKREIKTSGAYRLTAHDAVFGSAAGTAETILVRGIKQAAAMRLPVREPGLSQNGRGIFFERTPGGTASGLPLEGFEIVVTPDRITVRAVDERGCLYAAYALLERMEKKAGGLEIACATVRDWPDFSLRGACLELSAPPVRDVAIFKRYLDAYSRSRANTVVFLQNPKPVRAWMENKDDGHWTREQMAEIARHARWLHMDVWGGMGSKFNRRDFPEMEIHNEADYFDPLVEKNYTFLFRLYDEIIKTYAPSTLLIGHDEIQGLSVYAARSGGTTADLLSHAVGRIHAWLENKGLHTAMWGDMLLDHEQWEAKVGSANSQNPLFHSGATHLALSKLPKQVMILDWHYNARPSYESIRYFREKGFPVAGTPWHDPKAAQSLVESVKRFGGRGVISSDWGLLSSMSPAAATLHAQLCAWSGGCRIEQGDRDVEAMANEMRDPIYQAQEFKSVTASLSRAVNKSSFDADEGSGVFGVGPFFDLRNLAAGKIRLGHVDFDIEHPDGGRRNNCVVVANPTASVSASVTEKVVFEGLLQAQAVAFLNTCLVEEPQYYVRKLGHYVVEYENGSKKDVSIKENWNITDVRSSPGARRNAWTFNRSPEILIGALPVWRGRSALHIQLNLQLFIWENPHPDTRIRSIRLSAAGSPPNTKIVLLGLTFLQ